MIAHTSSAAIRSGPPQRGASRKRSATVPRTPAPESHRARQALTVLRQIPSLSAVPSIPRPSPKSNTMRARIASCCGVKDARIRRSSPSRSSSLNSILAALRPISSLHREIIATENQTTENKSLICESELTPTCTSSNDTTSAAHRFLAAARSDSEVLKGIVEADETYVLESRKGARGLGRKARRRGGKAKKRGLSREGAGSLQRCAAQGRCGGAHGCSRPGGREGRPAGLRRWRELPTLRRRARGEPRSAQPLDGGTGSGRSACADSRHPSSRPPASERQRVYNFAVQQPTPSIWHKQTRMKSREFGFCAMIEP